jgi:hypothetical protein
LRSIQAPQTSILFNMNEVCSEAHKISSLFKEEHKAHLASINTSNKLQVNCTPGNMRKFSQILYSGSFRQVSFLLIVPFLNPLKVCSPKSRLPNSNPKENGSQHERQIHKTYTTHSPRPDLAVAVESSLLPNRHVPFSANASSYSLCPHSRLGKGRMFVADYSYGDRSRHDK